MQLPDTENLVPLSAAIDPAEVGSKAAALARAHHDGYRVPEAVVLPMSVVDDVALRSPDPDDLTALISRLGGSVAVRSSALEEDRADASYAGQYETVLGITDGTALVAAVQRCRDSAHSAALASYAERVHAADGGIAILIQRMLAPSSAGVAFSVDPLTGADHVVIEATAGVGEALLAGEVTGERWTVADTPIVEGAPTILTAGEALRVAELCRSLATDAGVPVDIEWGFEGGELFLLQVRPVTVVPLEPTDRPPDNQSFVREPRFDGPITPLAFTSWLPRHGLAFTHTFERFGLPVETLDNRHYLGRVYTRVIPLVDRGKDGGEPPLVVMKLMFRLLPPMRKRLRRAAEWNGDEAINRLIDDWEATGRDRTHARTAELRSRALSSMTDGQLADHLDEVLAHLDQVARDHFDLTLGAMYIPTGRLGLLVEELLGWPPHDVVTLVQGYGQASVAHGEAIGHLIDSLGPEGVDAALADPATILSHQAAQPYLERYGHRVQMDLSVTTEAEDPSLIAEHIRRHLPAEGNGTDPTALAHEQEARALQAIRRPEDRQRFTATLALARRGRPYGDETEGTTLDAIALIRFVTLEAGRRFAGDGRLTDANDIWFVEQAELSAMLRSSDVSTPEIGRRHRRHLWALANPAPDFLGAEPPPPLSPTVVPKKLRGSVGACLWSLAASRPAPVEAPSSADTLHGIPGSPGTVAGPVRVVRDPSQFQRVEPGDIVVCPVTQASWSPIFGVIGGLVTEKGGPLSHPGTLAREYGLPAVLSAAGATEILQDGMRVRLDGAAGTIEILA